MGKSAKALGDVALIQEVVTKLRTIRAEQKLDPKKKMTAQFSSNDAAMRSLVEGNLATIHRLAVFKFGSDLRTACRRWNDSPRGNVWSSRSVCRNSESAGRNRATKKEIEGLQKAIGSKERQLGDEHFAAGRRRRLSRRGNARDSARELRILQDGGEYRKRVDGSAERVRGRKPGRGGRASWRWLRTFFPE